MARFRVNGHGGWTVRVRVPTHRHVASRLRVAAGLRRIVVGFTVTKSKSVASLQTSIAALSSGERVRLIPTRVSAGRFVGLRLAGFRRRAPVAVFLGRRRLRRLRASRHGAAQASVQIPGSTHAASYVLSVSSRGHRLKLRLAVTNSPPTIKKIPDQSGPQQAPISPISPSTTGSVTRFSASGLPPGIGINAQSGVISGAPSATGTYKPTVTAHGSASTASTTFSWKVSDPVVDAVGDMGCTVYDKNYNSGNGNPGVAAPGTDCLQKYVSNLVVNPLSSGLLDLGDNQYNNGGLSDYQNVFGKTFGRANAVTYPSLGNAEYGDGGQPPSGFFSYFGNTGVLSRIQASGGNTSHLTSDGYYSFNLGAWHIIALNSNCSGGYKGPYQVSGGCAAGSPQEQWLRQDLAANQRRCVMAYWHHPRWNSGSLGNNAATAAFWNDLYSAHATLVVNGHANHHYERFRPQDPSGNPALGGIREFIVSTGGQSHGVPPTTPGDPTTSEVTNYDTFGALRLTLHPNSYDWQFRPASDGQAGNFRDSGSGTCS